MAELLSKHYYIKYGVILKDEFIQSAVKDCIPSKQLPTKGNHWANLLKEKNATVMLLATIALTSIYIWLYSSSDVYPHSYYVTM